MRLDEIVIDADLLDSDRHVCDRSSAECRLGGYDRKCLWPSFVVVVLIVVGLPDLPEAPVLVQHVHHRPPAVLLVSHYSQHARAHLPLRQVRVPIVRCAYSAEHCSVEIIRLGQSKLIDWDIEMYHEETDTAAAARCVCCVPLSISHITQHHHAERGAWPDRLHLLRQGLPAILSLPSALTCGTDGHADMHRDELCQVQHRRQDLW